MAQLGARLDGIEEVVGSNPIGSTNRNSSITCPRGTRRPLTLLFSAPEQRIEAAIWLDFAPGYLSRTFLVS